MAAQRRRRPHLWGLEARIVHYNRLDNVAKQTKWSAGFHKPGSQKKR